MPELPEVETTVRGLEKILPGLSITDIWSDYKSPFHAGKDNIKNPAFFEKFCKEVVGHKISQVSRRAKNILIHLKNKQTILIHMKMTGHLLYGNYERVMPKKRKDKAHGWEHETWIPTADADGSDPKKLRDPFNKFIHFVLTLSNGKQLAFSDMRKFAKVTLLPTDKIEHSIDLKGIGPEPLDPTFTFTHFTERLAMRPKGRIKQVLMDQHIIAGVGNIYSDEILWYASIHPKSVVGNIPTTYLKKTYEEMQKILHRSIELGGDSMSDYRNLSGEKGGFHPYHCAYMQHGKICTMKNCGKSGTGSKNSNGGKPGIIIKMKIGQRSAHFCPVHQKLF